MRNSPEDRDRWTAERRKIVTTLWNEGQPASYIANVFGVSRSSILGLVHRMGLSNRRIGTAHAPRKPKPPTKFNFATNATKADPKPSEPYVHRETIVTPEHERVTFEALDQFDKRCRYPHGENPPYAYCGARAVIGQPWCLTHFKVCLPGLAAKHEATQQSEPLQKVQELEGVA